MDPFIVFLCPISVAKIAAEIDYRSGRIDGTLPSDVKAAESMLRDRIGHLVTVEFPLPVDRLDGPSDAVEAVANATSGGYYLYVVDAYTEQSRDFRVKGVVTIREGARERRLTIPLEHSEPGLDVATLVACGMDRNEAEDLVERFTASA